MFMRIFDCFMFYDEEMMLDLRLNYLNDYVDKFVIVESSYTHSGESRKLLFNEKKFEKFRDKIIYLVLSEQPENLLQIKDSDSFNKKNSGYHLNALKRENFQRNAIIKGLASAKPDDLIIISDVDEIPNLENNELTNCKNKIILFKQKIYNYKFNLELKSHEWFGSRACSKNNLISPQWLRNIKPKNYPLWRLDVFFSNNKYINIKFIENGGWHFSNLKSPAELDKKMRTFLHHREYDLNPLGEKKIQDIIENKKTIYNLKADKKQDKLDGAQSLTISNINELPQYIQKNKDKYIEWLETT